MNKRPPLIQYHFKIRELENDHATMYCELSDGTHVKVWVSNEWIPKKLPIEPHIYTYVLLQALSDNRPVYKKINEHHDPVNGMAFFRPEKRL